MTKEAIITRVLQPYADRPGQRLAILKTLRILIRHARDTGLLKEDPSFGIKRPKTEKIRSWTEEEIAQFESRWPIGTKQRLAFCLMLFTGQRRSDVCKFRWPDIRDDKLHIVQQKTGENLKIRLHINLREVLLSAPRNHVTIINTEYGRPFTVDGFSGFMRAAIKAAGLPLECQPHGLRKAAGRRLAEAGCTAKQIMAILGHKSLAEAERYTRQADQERLATAAIKKLETNKERPNIAKPWNPGLGKNRNTKGPSEC
jgi:enterobacteria phage integrase